MHQTNPAAYRYRDGDSLGESPCHIAQEAEDFRTRVDRIVGKAMQLCGMLITVTGGILATVGMALSISEQDNQHGTAILAAGGVVAATGLIVGCAGCATEIQASKNSVQP